MQTSDFVVADVGAHATAVLVETTIVARVDEEKKRPFPRHCRPHGTHVERSSVAGHRYTTHPQTRLEKMVFIN